MSFRFGLQGLTAVGDKRAILSTLAQEFEDDSPGPAPWSAADVHAAEFDSILVEDDLSSVQPARSQLGIRARTPLSGTRVVSLVNRVALRVLIHAHRVE
jgi:hypothetical protein